MSSGRLADHVGDHVVSSPEGAILVTSPGIKSSYPRPPHSLNPSLAEDGVPRCAPLPSPNLVPFGRVAARERRGALSRRAWLSLSGGYAPDSAKAKGSSIVDEPGEG